MYMYLQHTRVVVPGQTRSARRHGISAAGKSRGFWIYRITLSFRLAFPLCLNPWKGLSGNVLAGGVMVLSLAVTGAKLERGSVTWGYAL